ncbi:glycosyltransferase family 39 protein [Microtetraspora sp. AC03309]|uniref:glycosyltransferase family 39 protein n=1 Tax=Microtetraspora sp. AC03309 TaxID=2779376 RepID=UPI001E47C4D5|nr:glycosyltransferase family 39 protein [Microtetraspora sp. AC03309]MCC5574128.1 glycosyltransferase family 39 protein [Microtetraspora sp. AC03309]
MREHFRRAGWPLAAILTLQALLSLRLRNTAFQDEALYLYAGHMQLRDLFGGPPANLGFENYFSGSPWLYPVLAGAVDTVFGLAGARALSLAFLLGTTTLLYATTARLFGAGAGIGAAALFAATGPAIFLGDLATHDAAALFLLALAALTVVRAAATRTVATLAAAPILALASAVKYAAALYIPTICVLSALAAAPYVLWRRAVGRALLQAVATAPILLGLLYAGGLFQALGRTTTARPRGGADQLALLWKATQWGGALFLLACAGAVLLAVRAGNFPGATKTPGAFEPPGAALWIDRAPRAALVLMGVTLCCTALLAPAYHMYLRTGVSLHKHVGYGLLFAAPLAGLAVAGAVRSLRRGWVVAVAAWACVLALGVAHSARFFLTWQNSSALIAALDHRVRPDGRYLVEVSEVPIYYFLDRAEPRQWTSTYYVRYQDRRGNVLSGDEGYRAAIRDGRYDVIVLSWTATPGTADVIRAAVEASPRYRSLGVIPFRPVHGPGGFHVWVRDRTTGGESKPGGTAG